MTSATTIAALTALFELILKAGTWKIGGVLALIAFLPDIVFVVIIMVILVRYDRVLGRYDQALKTMERQHADFEGKYENNIELVKQVTKIAESLQDVVVYNTQVMQSVKDTVDNNLFCPLVRKDPKVEVRP